MSIRSGWLINRLIQLQMLANTARREINQLAQRINQRVFRDSTGLVRVQINRNRFGYTNRVGKLDGAARGITGGNHIFRQIAGNIGGGTVNLCRILPGEGTTTMRRGAAICSSNNFTTIIFIFTGRKSNFKYWISC